MSSAPLPALPVRQRLSHALLWAVLVTAAGSQSGLAQHQPPASPRLTPAQQTRLFPDLKALQLKDQQEQIQILQKAERCTRSASTPASLRSCMQERRRAHEAQRQQHREAMKALFTSNDVNLPAERGRAGPAQ